MQAAPQLQAHRYRASRDQHSGWIFLESALKGSSWQIFFHLPDSHAMIYITWNLRARISNANLLPLPDKQTLSQDLNLSTFCVCASSIHQSMSPLHFQLGSKGRFESLSACIRDLHGFHATIHASGGQA